MLFHIFVAKFNCHLCAVTCFRYVPILGIPILIKNFLILGVLHCFEYVNTEKEMSGITGKCAKIMPYWDNLFAEYVVVLFDQRISGEKI